METNLTKSIKERLRYFKPQLKTDMRTIRWAEEVLTPTGYVDVIRFEDYVVKDESHCARFAPDEHDNKNVLFRPNDIGKCKIDGNCYPCKECRGCVYRRTRHMLGMLSTCYEVKITVSDFKSNNGHNFHGNRNYYAVPNSIYPKIRELVPDGIGIIVYYSDSGHMTVKKECKHHEVDSGDMVYLLYNSMKKWVDGKQETKHTA